MRTQRIQVKHRRFKVKTGNTFVGVWECRSLREWAYRSYREAPLISLVIPRDEADRKKIRELILRKIST